MRTAKLTILSIALALGPPACGRNAAEVTSGDMTATASPSVSAPASATGAPSTTITPTPPPTPSPSPTPSTSPVLEDGRHFGYIRSIDVASDPAMLVFDLAYFLTGEEANREAAERGDEVPVPNDYYIVNDNPRLRTVPIAPDARVFTVEPGCCDLVRGDLARFAAAFDEPGPTDFTVQYRGGSSQYWLTVSGGEAVKIEEQFLP